MVAKVCTNAHLQTSVFINIMLTFVKNGQKFSSLKLLCPSTICDVNPILYVLVLI